MGSNSSKSREDEIVNSIKNQSETLKQLMSSEHFNLNNKVKELEKENQSLKKMIQARTITESLIKSRLNDSDFFEKTKSVVSRPAVEKFVDKMLENPEINITYLPDTVERQIYINVFCLILGLLEEMTDSMSIDIIGHVLKLKLDVKTKEELELPL